MCAKQASELELHN